MNDDCALDASAISALYGSGPIEPPIELTWAVDRAAATYECRSRAASLLGAFGRLLLTRPDLSTGRGRKSFVVVGAVGSIAVYRHCRGCEIPCLTNWRRATHGLPDVVACTGSRRQIDQHHETNQGWNDEPFYHRIAPDQQSRVNGLPVVEIDARKRHPKRFIRRLHSTNRAAR
jgi:hypothetical protein